MICINSRADVFIVFAQSTTFYRPDDERAHEGEPICACSLSSCSGWTSPALCFLVWVIKKNKKLMLHRRVCSLETFHRRREKNKLHKLEYDLFKEELHWKKRRKNLGECSKKLIKSLFNVLFACFYVLYMFFSLSVLFLCGLISVLLLSLGLFLVGWASRAFIN